MRAWEHAAALTLAAISYRGVVAAEPNETFGAATILAPNVRLAADVLTPGAVASPDTLLGIRDVLGGVYLTNDNGSPYGSGTGSGLSHVSTNTGSIDFSISGVGDDFFDGSHGESGDYLVYVDVYDFEDVLLDMFAETRTLAPGVVHDFSFNDFEWIGGYYDVYIDNAVGPLMAGDVDFFTFTGLTPGQTFIAQTLDSTSSGVDTRLGWFDEAGALIADDDDSAGGLLSLLEGAIPANGKLTFAVTGYDDVNYLGSHAQDAPYELELTIDDAPLAGDFNLDDVVDGEDLALWRASFGQTAAADADGDDDSDGADFLTWQRQLGSDVGAADAASAAVPEPNAAALAALMIVALSFRTKSTSPGRG